MDRSLVISSTAFGVPYGKLTQAASAQLWPIIKHYAETGELVEAPPPVAEDAISIPDRVTELERYIKYLETRLTALEAQHSPGHAHRAGEPQAGREGAT